MKRQWVERFLVCAGGRGLLRDEEKKTARGQAGRGDGKRRRDQAERARRGDRRVRAVNKTGGDRKKEGGEQKCENRALYTNEVDKQSGSQHAHTMPQADTYNKQSRRPKKQTDC